MFCVSSFEYSLEGCIEKRVCIFIATSKWCYLSLCCQPCLKALSSPLKSEGGMFGDEVWGKGTSEWKLLFISMPLCLSLCTLICHLKVFPCDGACYTVSHPLCTAQWLQSLFLVMNNCTESLLWHKAKTVIIHVSRLFSKGISCPRVEFNMGKMKGWVEQCHTLSSPLRAVRRFACWHWNRNYIHWASELLLVKL